MLVRVVLDLMLYGPRGGPGRGACETYQWLTSIRVGRLALRSIWFGVNLALLSLPALTALWVRRAEFS